MAAHLRGLTPETLVERFPDVGFNMPQARRVITRLVHDYRDDLDDIPGLRKTRAEALLAGSRRDRLEVTDRRRSAVDPFVKYLFRAGDGRVFEAVRIPLEQPRFSVCVSSQAGCALGCAFCETGRMGFERNLEPWEIVDQVLRVAQQVVRSLDVARLEGDDRTGEVAVDAVVGHHDDASGRCRLEAFVAEPGAERLW